MLMVVHRAAPEIQAQPVGIVRLIHSMGFSIKGRLGAAVGADLVELGRQLGRGQIGIARQARQDAVDLVEQPGKYGVVRSQNP